MIIDPKHDTVIIEAEDIEAYNRGKKLVTRARDDGWHDGKQGLFISTEYEPFVAWLDDMAYSIDPRIPREEKDVYVDMLDALEEADNLIIEGRSTEPVESSMFSMSYEDRPGHYRRYDNDIGEFKTVSFVNVPEIEHDALSDSMPIEHLAIKGDTTLDSWALANANIKHLSVQRFQAKNGVDVCPVGLCYGILDLESADCEEGAVEIETSAFENCPEFKYIDTSHVKNIGPHALQDTAVDVSKQNFSSLQTLGPEAIDGCPASNGTMTVGKDFDTYYMENIPDNVQKVYMHKSKNSLSHNTGRQSDRANKTVPAKFEILAGQAENSDESVNAPEK